MKFAMKMTPTGATFTVDGKPIAPEDVLSVEIAIRPNQLPHVVLAVKLTEVDVDLAAASIAKVPVPGAASVPVAVPPAPTRAQRRAAKK